MVGLFRMVIKSDGINQEEGYVSPWFTDRLQFAEKALKLRYNMGDSAPYGPDRLLTLRRYSDKGLDLFSTLNVVQENLTQTNYARWNGEKTARKVGLVKDMELNRGIWQLAEDFALAR